MSKIVWNKVWRDFNNWCDRTARTCPECKRDIRYPTWKAQRLKIEEIVEEYLKDSPNG